MRVTRRWLHIAVQCGWPTGKTQLCRLHVLILHHPRSDCLPLQLLNNQFLQDESDQALAAYRTAARLFPGLHTPLLGMGCAYQRMNNLHLCERCFLQARSMCPHDPAVAHELGVLAYRCAGSSV
jgi:Flp pilus assembly protein TadD